MSDEKQIRIDTTDDFLRWLDTGRQLAIETLTAAGIGEAQAQKFSQTGVFAGSTISSTSQSPVYITQEIEAAFNLLQLTKRIKSRLTGVEKVEPFAFVLDGILLNDFRQEIYRTQWRKMDHSSTQSKNAKNRRTPTAALADELRRSHDWKESLPRRIGARESIGHLNVTLQRDGLFLIEDRKTGKSKAVKLESIAKKIRT